MSSVIPVKNLTVILLIIIYMYVQTYTSLQTCSLDKRNRFREKINHFLKGIKIEETGILIHYSINSLFRYFIII
jgi:hypothetical protein